MLGDECVKRKIVLTFPIVGVKDIILFLEFGSPIFLPGVLIYNCEPRSISVFTLTVWLNRTCMHCRACCLLQVEIEGRIVITVEGVSVRSTVNHILFNRSKFISVGLVGNKRWDKIRNINCLANNVRQRNSLRSNNLAIKLEKTSVHFMI